MRWPWTRSREPAPRDTRPRNDDDENGLDEAQQALDHVLSRWPDVTRVAEDMRSIRRRNHLADKVHDALGGHSR